MSKHILYLTNDKLVALLIKRGSIVGRETFALSDIDVPVFGDYLARYRETPTHLVTDLIEEDFRLDTIPHLRGSDQEAVISRKLSQIYRASPFRHAIIQGRETEGRRDDKVFYHAITNPDLVKSVLAALESRQVSLEGIYSSAVLSSRLLKELDIFFPHTLLVTIVPDFGLRQTYFQNKQIKFSRLTPIIYDESQTVGQLIAAETSRTWQYLDSLRNFGSDDSLEVCLLVHERDKLMLQDAIRTYPLLRYRFLDINEVAAKLGVTPAPTSSHADEILSHLYARGGIENHFAEPEQTRYSAFRKARMAITGITAGVLIAGVAGAGFNVYQASKVSDMIAKNSAIERGMQTEYASITNAIRQQKLATDSVRDSSIFFNSQIRPTPASPGGTLRDIATTSASFNTIRLVQVAWSVSNDTSATPSLQTVDRARAAAVTSETKASTSVVGAIAKLTNLSNSVAAANASVALDINTPLPGNKFHIVALEGAISPYDGNLRAALAEIERYVAQLRAMPGYQVTIISMPVDTSVRANLKVVEKPQAEGIEEARFQLKLVKTVAGT